VGGHESNRFRAEKAPHPLQSVALLCDESPAASAAIARGESLARGTLFAKYLVEAPPNVCNPSYLAAAAQSIAAKFPDTMTCTVLERADCESLGMGCYLGVAEVRNPDITFYCPSSSKYIPRQVLFSSSPIIHPTFFKYSIVHSHDAPP
jgi:leucyl aminopeptidase